MRPLSKAFRRYPKGTALLLLGLILYGWCVASTHADDPSAEIVAEWDFGTKEDIRRDGWPDGWLRRIGRDFPKFIPIAIHQDLRTNEELAEIDSFRRLCSQLYVAWQQSKWPWQVIPEKVPPAIDLLLERTLLNPYLRAQMDGGAVELSSPMVPVEVHSVYFMTATIHSDSPDYEASAKLRFLDNTRKPLFEMPTKAYSGKTNWKAASTDSQYPHRNDLAFVQVVLQVQPKSIKAYRGEFGFDAIRIFRSPRLSLSVDKPIPYYRSAEEVVVRCAASGMTSDQSSIKFVLTDHTGQQVAQPDVPLNAQNNKLISLGNLDSKKSKPSYWDGNCEWRLTDLAPGYYEVSTQLAKGKSGLFELRDQFVVLPEDLPLKPDSRFGWTMSARNNEDLDGIDTNRLVEILRIGHVGKVKLPIWYDSQDSIASKATLDRVDRVQMNGVTCVGVIASPPRTIRDKFLRLNPQETGSGLEDSVLVQSFLEPVMRQMCARLSEFQIGWDHETDFISNPRLSPALDSIRVLLRKHSQETQLIAANNPLIATSKNPLIDRWQLNSPQTLTSIEQDYLLRKREAPHSTGKVPWISLTPISASMYALSERVQDLVARMLSIAGEPGLQNTTAWIANPTEQEVGLLDADGGPREMFLPFRTTALALSGMRQIGSLPVPSLGVNYLVTSGEQARLIAWSARKTTAQLYLGPDVSARDVWGRVVPVDNIDTPYGSEQRITIDKWPIIISGIDGRVARWRMGIGLQESRIDPLVGETQSLNVRFANPLSSPVNGIVRVIAPTVLAEEADAILEIESNSNGIISVPVQVRADASTSNASIKLKFLIQGEKPVSFVVDQEVQVGTSDFEFELRYQLEEDNRIKIYIEAINHQSSPISFDCLLLIPNRPRSRTQISGLQDRITKLIVLENAEELIGKTLWLRCEQISTKRVLNYRIEINPDSAKQ